MGGHSIGHSKRKCLYGRVLFRTVSEIELFECTTAKLLVRKRYYVYVLFLIPVFIVQVTELVQGYNKCSKIPPSTSMHFATRVKTWRVVRLSASCRFFMQGITSSKLMSSSSRVTTFVCTLHASQNPINKNLTGLSLEIFVAS